MEKSKIINWIAVILGVIVLVGTLISGHHSLFLQSLWIVIAIFWIIIDGLNITKEKKASIHHGRLVDTLLKDKC